VFAEWPWGSTAPLWEYISCLASLYSPSTWPPTAIKGLSAKLHSCARMHHISGARLCATQSKPFDFWIVGLARR
jgi:hypothetical protein